MADCEICCGFGGTFAVKLAPISVAIADEKVAHVVETGAHYLAGTDLGCLMNIAGRMQVLGVKVEAVHIAELVDRAQRTSEGVRT
jgi:L-lactate dehydrogenase complex protein LldE